MALLSHLSQAYRDCIAFVIVAQDVLLWRCNKQ